MNEPSQVVEAAGIRCITAPTPFLIPSVNLYLVERDVLILFDVGTHTDDAYDALVTGLAHHGYKLSDLDAIVATHNHLDHTGQLQRIADESGAETFAHCRAQSELARFDERVANGWAAYKERITALGAEGEALKIALEDWRMDSALGRPARVDHALNHGDTVFGFEVHYVPGHSATDLLFVDRESGVAIVGDHVLKTMNPNPLLRVAVAGQEPGKALVELRRSLRYTRERDLGVLAPGHGEPFTNHVAMIDKILSRHERKNQKILELLSEKTMSPVELSHTMFPDLEPEHLILGVSVTLGHCEVLEEDGVLVRDEKDGVTYYAIAEQESALRYGVAN